MSTPLCRRAVLLLGLLLTAQAATAESPTVVLASTTSVDNSGLLARILPVFTAQTGIMVRVLALGTGQALAVTARGDADLVLVHDPDAEQRFMDEEYGAERYEVAWNDFIIVARPRTRRASLAAGTRR